MADFRIDRLKHHWKNTWLPSTKYNINDIVYYKGKTFNCQEVHTSSSDFYTDYGLLPRHVKVTVLNEKFYFNGIEAPVLDLKRGETYFFDVSDQSCTDYTLRFSITADGTNNAAESGIEFIDSVTVTGVAGTENAQVILVVRDNTPQLYYFSPDFAGMENQISVANSIWTIIHDGCTWRQDWEISTYYTIGDIIKWKGYIYQCTRQHTSQPVLSVGPVADIHKWKLIATTYNWLNNWTESFNYNLGDVVIYNGITYICTEKHRSASTTQLGLEADQDKWNIVTRSDKWTADWQPNYRYLVDDIVKYGGIVYRCIEGHSSAATIDLGLEADQLKWEISVSGVEYKFDWQPNTRYKANDIVKSGATLFICLVHHISGSLLRNNGANWEVWIPGLQYEELWDENTEYQIGDIVLYGGYAYTALTNNLGSTPSVNDKLQDTGDWELLKEGYTHRGEWEITTEYRTGDVVRNLGYLYIATKDTLGVYPDSDFDAWRILTTGRQFRAEWKNEVEYFVGDLVTYASTLYICIARHNSEVANARPDIDAQSPVYWQVHVQGTDTNVLTTRGDIRTHNETETSRLAIGTAGQSLKVINNGPTWDNFEELPKTFYVSPSGQDIPTSGTSANSAFKTIRYACEFIFADEVNRTPATIFVKTGVYQEILPISIPADVALVGDELRSTNVMPAAGYEQSDMFYVRNGCGIRNMTLSGLQGTLGTTPNEYGTVRPTAGAFVSLDPGTGPDDTSVWIVTKSPYVQNVTTFGDGCIGMKIDGALHNGGNRSTVANDFTQILSDGIGYWADNQGLSELVSVFTYYNYIGYLATNGGKLRATNGNNSYGAFGSRAEGFDDSETPLLAEVDNRANQAGIDRVYTNGTNVLAVGYSNAGEEYSPDTTVIDIVGSNNNINAQYTEVRDGGVFQGRILPPDETSSPGGLNYQFLLNNAQGGDNTSIILAAADTFGNSAAYVGMRVFIESGRGSGQFGYITAYDEESKVATISKESDDSAGWDHVYPGYPIQNTLDATTRYTIEPRIIVDEPTYSNTPQTIAGAQLVDIAYGNDIWVALSSSPANILTSEDGINWTTTPMPVAQIPHSIAFGNGRFVITFSGLTDIYVYGDGTSWFAGEFNSAINSAVATFVSDNVWIAVGLDSNIQRSVTNAASFNTITYSLVTDAKHIASSTNTIVITTHLGTATYISTDSGLTWNTIAGFPVADITYGNGRFVAITSTDSNVSYYSFDGETWYTGNIDIPAEEWKSITYSNGLFVATSSTENVVAHSTSGKTWKSIDDNSTVKALSSVDNWAGAAHGQGKWLFIAAGSNRYEIVTTGARAVLRASVESARIVRTQVIDPGGDYTSNPVVLIDDPVATIFAVIDARIGNGVLSQPTFLSRGTGYNTATATVSGLGYADNYQVGRKLNLKNLSRAPRPGDNLNIPTVPDITFRIVAIDEVTGNEPDISAQIRVSPIIEDFMSPEHEDVATIRQKYSQVRLTGHDFLDIGTGNFDTSNYPDLYLFGEGPDNDRKPFNEVTDIDGGRVFYTSTDQDGNFRVGELFTVEQSTGIVSVNADFFDLDGLTELSLGGIRVGGTAVVIREFSKDPFFVANSNNIVPTQRAIASYLASRISNGGADALTNTLIAGQVRVTANTITTTSDLQINVKQKVTLDKGADGHYLASMYFGI